MVDRDEVNTQSRSRFFSIPQEIRDYIYRYVFSGTRLSYADQISGCHVQNVTIPARNSLALLKTCWRMKLEIGDTWIGYVLFNFGDHYTMLRKLSDLPRKMSDLPPYTISKIRHVRVCDIFHWCNTRSLSFLIPGLRLDCLTVLEAGESIVPVEVSALLRTKGWKELNYLSLGSNGRYYKHHLRRSLVMCKPHLWPKVLGGWHREGTKPLVTIYRPSNPFSDEPGACADRTEANEGLAPRKRTSDFDTDIGPTPFHELTGDFLVVAKRGSGAAKGGTFAARRRRPPEYEQRLLHIKESTLNWWDEQLRSEHLLRRLTGQVCECTKDGSNDQPCKYRSVRRRVVTVDAYTYPDEYDWSHTEGKLPESKK